MKKIIIEINENESSKVKMVGGASKGDKLFGLLLLAKTFIDDAKDEEVEAFKVFLSDNIDILNLERKHALIENEKKIKSELKEDKVKSFEEMKEKKKLKIVPRDFKNINQLRKI